MFEVEFNYEKLLKDDNRMKIIKNYFVFSEENNNDKFNQIFSRENLEFIMKEVSMQYFFKGSDGQYNPKTKPKDKLCEEILDYDNICTVQIKSYSKNKAVKKENEKSEKDQKAKIKINAKEEQKAKTQTVSASGQNKSNDSTNNNSNIEKLLSGFKENDINTLLNILKKKTKNVDNSNKNTKPNSIPSLMKFKEVSSNTEIRNILYYYLI